MEAGFACGSMVLFLSFSQKCGSVSHIFVKEDVQFCPAGGDISRQMWDRLIHGSIGGSRCSLISWCSWSKLPLCNFCSSFALRMVCMIAAH